MSFEGVEPGGKGRQREDQIGASEQRDEADRRRLKQRLDERRQTLALERSSGCRIAGETLGE